MSVIGPQSPEGTPLKPQSGAHPQDVNARVQNYAQEKLSSLTAPSDQPSRHIEIERTRAAKKPFMSETSGGLAEQLIAGIEDHIERGLDDVPIPEELIAKWKENLELTTEKDRAFENLRDELPLWHPPHQTEDFNLSLLQNFFDPNAVYTHLLNFNFRKFHQLAFPKGHPNMDDYLGALGYLYRMRTLVINAYKALPDQCDLSAVSSFFRVEQHKNETIVVPSIYGTALIAAYYEVKYKLPIHVGTNATFQRLIASNDDSISDTFGFILFQENRGDALHVTPMIVFRKKTGEREILQLDSVASEDYYLETPIKQTNLRVKRQADPRSCRNDALNILSNALWDIRKKEAHSIADFPETAEQHLPTAWGKTAQLSTALLDVDLKAPVRTTQADKTLEHFLEAHSETVGEKKVRKYLNQKGKKYAAKILELVQNKDKYPEIWAAFTKKLNLFEPDGFSLTKEPLSKA